jgi:hypothetical protein
MRSRQGGQSGGGRLRGHRRGRAESRFPSAERQRGLSVFSMSRPDCPAGPSYGGVGRRVQPERMSRATIAASPPHLWERWRPARSFFLRCGRDARAPRRRAGWGKRLPRRRGRAYDRANDKLGGSACAVCRERSLCAFGRCHTQFLRSCLQFVRFYLRFHVRFRLGAPFLAFSRFLCWFRLIP